LKERKKSLNDENTFYLNNNRPRLDIFKIITSLDIKSNNEEYHYKEELSNKKNYFISVITDTNVLNEKIELVKNKSNSSNNNLDIINENKEYNINEFNIYDNFKRLKSDLIPKDDFFDNYFEEDDNLSENKTEIIKLIERKHSY